MSWNTRFWRSRRCAVVPEAVRILTSISLMLTRSPRATSRRTLAAMSAGWGYDVASTCICIPTPSMGTPACLRPLTSFVDAVRLLPFSLGVVLVVEEERPRVGLTGRAEGVRDVAGAQAAGEDRIA